MRTVLLTLAIVLMAGVCMAADLGPFRILIAQGFQPLLVAWPATPHRFSARIGD